MGAVTYPNPDVVRELSEHFVPVRIESAKQPEHARRMNVRWLPGLVVAGADERPANVVVGFLPPSDLLPELTFGRAIAAMGEKRYDEAHTLLEQVAGTKGAERAAEALYWLGVSRYRQSKDFMGSIREPWGRIVETWPGSQWARKVGFAVGKPAGA
jgi:hypothetical protein